MALFKSIIVEVKRSNYGKREGSDLAAVSSSSVYEGIGGREVYEGIGGREVYEGIGGRGGRDDSHTVTNKMILQALTLLLSL